MIFYKKLAFGNHTTNVYVIHIVLRVTYEIIRNVPLRFKKIYSHPKVESRFFFLTQQNYLLSFNNEGFLKKKSFMLLNFFFFF